MFANIKHPLNRTILYCSFVNRRLIRFCRYVLYIYIFMGRSYIMFEIFWRSGGETAYGQRTVSVSSSIIRYVVVVAVVVVLLKSCTRDTGRETKAEFISVFKNAITTEIISNWSCIFRDILLHQVDIVNKKTRIRGIACADCQINN